MYDDSPSAQSCTFPKRVLACAREFRRQFSNPLALGLLGLALAVTLSGYGHKLSQYRNLSNDSAPRIPVAKLWIEHRFGFDAFSKSATALNLKARVYAHSNTPVLIAAAPQFYFQGNAGLLSVTARPRVIPFFHAAIPLRSPPVNISL